MLRAAQGCSGSEQLCTATAQGCLFIAQVAVTCVQVSKWKWNLERSRFGCEYYGIRAQCVTPNQDTYWSPYEIERQCEASLLCRNEVVSIYPPLSQAHTEKLLTETIHALTAISGHENPPARYIVGVEGVFSVKEKLKTVSEELEDFIEASNAVDVPRKGSHENVKAETADGEDDGPVDFGSHDTEDRNSHS
jgi:hypothetical protein